MSGTRVVSTRRPRRAGRCAALAVLLAAACRAPDSPRAVRPAGAVSSRPELEEIFLEPPLSGRAPRIESLSPDGAFCLLRWSPTAVEEDDGPLRLLRVDDPDETGRRGMPLEELLAVFPTTGADRDIAETIWAGALLVVARGPEVLFFDPARGRTGLAFAPPPAPAPAVEEGAAAAADAARPALGAIRNLALSPDGRELRFDDGVELYSLPLPAELPADPLVWEDVTWHSAALTADVSDLRWSDDLAHVFGKDPLPRETPSRESQPDVAGAAGDAEAAGAEDPPAEHVVHLVRGSGTHLAGLDELRALEDSALSPDGRFLFGVEVDRGGEPAETLVPDYLEARVSVRKTRRKLADDGPSPQVLWMWDTATGARTGVGAFGPPPPAAEGAPPDAREPWWFSDIGWAPQTRPGAPARFAFERLSADHRELEIWCWSEDGCERLWHERDERWIGGPTRSARWSRDGSLLLVGSESWAESTTPGRSQLFAVWPDGRVRQLTAVPGELARFQALENGGVLCEASLDEPARREVLLLPPPSTDAPLAPPARYPLPPGWNSSAQATADGERIVLLHEELLRPAEVWSATRAAADPLTRTVPPVFERLQWIRPERLKLVLDDGTRVRAHVYLPRGVTLAAPGPPRATVVFAHGAGYLQNVTESMTRYPLNAMFHSRLADLGYPVIDVDYRGSAGYGRDFRTDVQYHLGGKDLGDIDRVVDHLVARGLVDPERVGIYGGSYGGFLTLMALATAPERWAVGAALRSVTDWRTYEPGYTQPRLGRPSTHPEAYARSSPIDHVDGVQDPVLILHGMLDSNVFAQDSIRFIERLIDRGHDFEAMLYPSQGHAFEDGPHWLDEYRRIERFLLAHLGPPLRAESAP